MSLIHDIQSNLLDETLPVFPALLKLRFLAAKLGDVVLEDWVKYELNGYEAAKEVPEYRRVGLLYKASYLNMAYKMLDQPVPPQVIYANVSPEALIHKISENLAVIDHTIAQAKDETELMVDASHMLAAVRDKVYSNLPMISLKATFPVSALIGIQVAVRSRALDLTIELQRQLPQAEAIEISSKELHLPEQQAERVGQISNYIIYGNQTNVTSSGTNSAVSVTVVSGDRESLKQSLAALGLDGGEAEELAEIVANEKPEKGGLGARAAGWIAARVAQGADGLLKIGAKVIERDLTKAIQDFYDGMF